MNLRTAALASVICLVGCDVVDDARNWFDGLTNSLVVEAVVIGVDPPQSDEIDLSNTEFELGTNTTVFLADASEASQIDNTPINDADVMVRASAGEVQLRDGGEGVYVANTDDGLDYEQGATWEVVIGLGDGTAKGTVVLPQPANFTLPAQHTANESLTIDLTGQGYEQVLAIVVDNATGETTWTNAPNSGADVYDFTARDGEVGLFEIPRDAFPNDSFYAVGIAGIVFNEPGSLSEMNTLLSNMMAGRMRIDPLLVGDL